jgi:hypothetical protein
MGQTSVPETLVIHQKWRRVTTQEILSNITTTAEAFNYVVSFLFLFYTFSILFLFCFGFIILMWTRP